jgi:predicted amino acid racemase
MFGKTSTRAIVDIGQLDINPDFLIPVNPEVTVVDASSDMLVLDVGDNPRGLKVGDAVSFSLKYMGALGIMNSRYIDKIVE